MPGGWRVRWFQSLPGISFLLTVSGKKYSPLSEEGFQSLPGISFLLTPSRPLFTVYIALGFQSLPGISFLLTGTLQCLDNSKHCWVSIPSRDFFPSDETGLGRNTWVGVKFQSLPGISFLLTVFYDAILGSWFIGFNPFQGFLSFWRPAASGSSNLSYPFQSLPGISFLLTFSSMTALEAAMEKFQSLPGISFLLTI